MSRAMNDTPSITANPSPNDMLSRPQAAEVLGICPGTLYRLDAKGLGPPRRRHGLSRIFYKRAELLAWSEAQRVTGKKEESARQQVAPAAPRTAPIGEGRMVAADTGRDRRTLPHRPPIMRDEDPRSLGFGSDRAFDEDWFAEHPSRFRILSTINSDTEHAGIEQTDSCRSVRLSRYPGACVAGRPGLYVPAAIVFMILTEDGGKAQQVHGRRARSAVAETSG
jgi:Helix-turn-helix domain